MIQTQVALMRREVWEHRSIFVVPGVVALFVMLSSLLGQVTISDLEHVDLGIIGATNMPENARGVLINLVAWLMNGTTVPNAVVAAVLFAQAIKLIPARS